MNVEEYLRQNQEAIAQQCERITNSGSKAIITAKKNAQSYVHQVSTVEEFTDSIPDNQFFKSMRDGINNAVSHRVIPIVVFEGQQAKIISLPEYFELKK